MSSFWRPIIRFLFLMWAIQFLLIGCSRKLVDSNLNGGVDNIEQQEPPLMIQQSYKDEDLISTNSVTTTCRIESFKILGTLARGMVLYDYESESTFMVYTSIDDYVTLIEGDYIKITYDKDTKTIINWSYINMNDLTKELIVE